MKHLVPQRRLLAGRSSQPDDPWIRFNIRRHEGEHGCSGEEVGAACLRQWQRVHHEGVLRSDVAAGHAVSAPRARGLRDPRRVFAGRREGDGQRRAIALFAEGIGEHRERPVLLGLLPVACVNSEQGTCLLEPLIEVVGISPDLVRPSLVAKICPMRSRRDIRVDQRSATEPASHEDVHCLADPDIEQRVRIPDWVVSIRAMEPDMTGDVTQIDREVAECIFAPALEDYDVATVAGETGGGNAPPVSRTHDRDIDVGEDGLAADFGEVGLRAGVIDQRLDGLR